MRTVIYHNPRCSKSRATCALLKEHGVEPEEIHYLETPPSVEDLEGLCALLSVEPQELIRFKEARAKELGIAASDERSQRAWCELIAANPILLERPIVVVDGKRAAIGRPPENVLSVIE
jgi:arsenate reductase